MPAEIAVAAAAETVAAAVVERNRRRRRRQIGKRDRESQGTNNQIGMTRFLRRRCQRSSQIAVILRCYRFPLPFLPWPFLAAAAAWQRWRQPRADVALSTLQDRAGAVLSALPPHAGAEHRVLSASPCALPWSLPAPVGVADVVALPVADACHASVAHVRHVSSAR